jgi:hypothetical protein
MNELSEIDRHWALLAAVDRRLWRHYESKVDCENRRREALELLASVTWHLELAFKLGDLPDSTMIAYRESSLSKDKLLPWGRWVEQRVGLVVSPASTALRLDYSFSSSPDPRSIYVLQATLIGDAVMRLVGIADILRGCVRDMSSEIFCNTRLAWKDVESRLADQKVLPIGLVVAFRDCYAHAERSPSANERYRLMRFRNTLHERFSLGAVAAASLIVWETLFNAGYKT